MPQLATFYIAAQIIERITELLSGFGDKPRAKKKDEDLRFRAKWLWAASSLLGVLLAFLLKLGFFAQTGLQDIDPTIDHVLSGIALGGGAKPIHDILAYMEKASEKRGK